MIERRGSCTWRTIVGAILLTMGPVVASVTAASLLGGPPKNDLCENAISVSVPGSVFGFTIDATIDDTFPFCGTSITAPGIWYTVIGTGNTITATTCSELTDYDTKISVYCNFCDAPTCVDGNDDDCDPFGLLSTVQWCSQAGAVYLILVHGFGNATGGFTLSFFDDGVACGDPVDCLGGGGCGDPDAGSCFEVHPTPFCDDVLCCLIVCAIDPFCCDSEWDELCVDAAQDSCAGCGSPGAGSCFENNGTPGCDDAECCALICDVDPFCCDDFWDGLCADEAVLICAGCGGLDAGSCFVVHPTPFCDNAGCCALVCEADSFCCDTEWDEFCADAALDLCGNSACPGDGSCFEDNGTPGCDDPICCNTVCLFDPFCCDSFWDQICADEAADLCIAVSPKNDLCENAIPVPVPGFVVGFTTHATIDDTFPFCDTSITAPGIWYSVIGTGNTITATTCSEFTEYNTKISVYCSCLDPICVGGNDDDCDMFGGLHSTVTWCSQAGAEYLILVHGFGDLTGGFDLSVFDDGAACLGPANCLPPDPCPADLDVDGVVGVKDLLFLLGAWGPCPKKGDCLADLVVDGVVGVKDLLFLLGTWGPCPL